MKLIAIDIHDTTTLRDNVANTPEALSECADLAMAYAGTVDRLEPCDIHLVDDNNQLVFEFDFEREIFRTPAPWRR